MTEFDTYIADLMAWREQMDTNLRAEGSWLALAGLHWLTPNTRMTIGSDPDCDIVLPANGVPPQLGYVTLNSETALFETHSDSVALIDGNPVESSAILQSDHAESGPTEIKVGSVTFFLIQRTDQYGIRVLDRESPTRLNFTGRRWFMPDPSFRVAARFTPNQTPRSLTIINSVGMAVPMENPGSVTFTLCGQDLRLEAFTSQPGKLWFIFKDGTNGKETYGAGRFLTAPLAGDNTVDLDFNRAYSPPCAFTEYATCPLAPRENYLPIRIEAGEMD